MNSGFRRRGSPNPGVGNLVGDPFAFSTVSIGTLGWLLTLVASVFCQIRSPDQFSKFIWWVVAYELLCIVFVAWTIIQDVKEKYAPAVIGYLAISAGFLTLSINQLVFSSAGERVANAVGFILLSIVTFLWIFYFGSNGQSHHEYPLPKDARYSTRQPSRPMSHNNFDRPRTTASGQNPQVLYTSTQLNGFETSSPVSGYPGGPVGAQDRNMSNPRFQGASHPQTPTTAKANNPLLDGPGEMEGPTEYPYSAKAIYAYEANPDDANEISFVKHEILEVSDVSGRWWQARKQNGEKGIAPSNYLILL